MNKNIGRIILFPVFVILFAAGICTGCSPTGRPSSPTTGNGIVYIRAVQEDRAEAVSRTYIGGDELDKVFWSELDEIGVYWGTVDNPSVLSGHRFGCYRAYPGEALFSAAVEAVPEGEYVYYGAYPPPETVSGTTVTYNLPAIQDGSYETSAVDIRDQQSHAGYKGNNDFMLAVPVTGPSLTSSPGQMALGFIHQCHVMRIQVPAGRDQWGAEIRKLRVEFPSDVAGTMTMDMAAPWAAPKLGNGTSVVVAELAGPLTESVEDDPEGCYVWLFLCPGIINGEVRFTAYDANGYQSAPISVMMDKTLEAGRITPVNLTIPQELPVTWIDFSLTGNELGEEPVSLTVKAPEGARFRNGTDTRYFAANDRNIYSLGFYNEYDGIDNGALIRDGILTFTYESANAIVSQERTIGEFTPEGRTTVGLTVPYLFFEDFSGAVGTGQENSTAELGGYNLPGWSGSRFGLQSNTAAMISAYLGSAVITDPDSGDNKRGRLDTPFLSGIKEGSSVTLSVSFDIGGTKEDGTLSNCKVLYSMYEFGSDTAAGNLEYTKSIENPAIGGEDAGIDGSYTNLPLHKSAIEVTGCTNRHRLSWRTTFRVYDPNWWSALTSKTVYVYIDNIKVSIKK